ncbi:EAL domain-containing protein [Brevundimonas goettingensis]|uniref:histidine kinase n=1 Tax=Brevundimonas goettingensis TaxID=2774190 RepID=A0A975GUP5_9CAUL|nr:EAL domain-containing protein [Brevundimonas goettingensis]QTC90447.1 EAL domain-containing protein [Brevundimonas goettingensis]
MLASLLASFLVTATVSTWIDLRRQTALETNRLTQTARVIGSLASDAVAADDRTESFKAIRSVAQMPGITYARLRSSRSGLLAETGAGARLISDATVDGAEGKLSIWSVLSTGSIQVTAPVMSEGETVGTITIFSRTPELRGRVLSTIWTTLAGALVAVVAGLIVAQRMARKISAPIVALAGLVRRVDETRDFSAKIDIEADGEVADLVAGVDTFLAGIRERDARIAAQVEGLEIEVAARTEELVVARDAAEQANAAKSDFLAVMSHEIRTPLNGILALSDMLATSDLPQRQQRYADVIAKSGRSLLSIINDILDFSKVEAGKMDLETVEVDLAEAAEDVASLFSEKAASKGLDLAVFVDPRLPLVLADPTRLRQVIGNLVNNAIKFTDAGGVLIAIDRDPDGGDHVRVSVQDTGPGIAEDKLPTLFEAFAQADQSTTRTHGGTGLGLAICDRLVRSMGGVWALSSTVGEGSTFAFSAPFERAGPVIEASAVALGGNIIVRGLAGQTRAAVLRYLCAWGVGANGVEDGAAIVGAGAPVPAFGVTICDSEDAAEDIVKTAADACVLVKPVRRADLSEVVGQMRDGVRPRLTHRSGQPRAGTTFPGVRVLVVDDSDVNREVAVEALSRLGVETFTAEDGRQAVERLRKQTFDLVLMDGSMPVMDGFEATRAIRAEEAVTQRPRAAIVALTAHVVGSGADAWKASGMDGVVHKPFTLEDLVRTLGRFCADRAVVEADQPRVAVLAPPSATDAGQDDVRTDLFDPVVRGELLAMGRNGRADFVQRVHGLYAANAPLRLAEIVESANNVDRDGLARAAHALKSMSLSLGAAAVARETSRIETAARSGEAIPAIGVDDIQSLVSLTLAEMEGAGPAPAAALTAEEELAAGIERGELHLVYQPLVDRRGQLSGKVEALIRWIHPRQGRLNPDDFIPRLESEGGIARLTDFVMTRAMQDLGDRPDVTVSINASASEFQAPGFADRVAAAAAAARFAPQRLEVEVTETAMLDVPAAGRTIDALREKGFGVALDDFGAGFTSLHALRELKFTTLKVDRSFVERCTHDTASAAIIHAVIGVGRALGMKVVCEGIETAEQAEFLRIAGAHYLQGYHFYRPLTLDALPGADEEAA